MRLRHLAILALAGSAAGCSVVTGIFKAGFWLGVVFAVAIVIGLMMLVRRR
jgi:hypothetical protein